MRAPVALYVHIPFCSKRCPYCAFYKLIWSADEECRFIDAAIVEMQMYAQAFGRVPLRSVFWGGGTPSILTPAGIARLWEAIEINFDVRQGIEKTIEANPESLTDDRLAVFCQYGVNRISVGVQSFRETELVQLGREHTFLSIEGRIARIREHGIHNLNLDFIYGLKGQTVADIEFSISKAIAIDPTHISTYALSIEPGTVYYKTGVTSADDDTQLVFYQLIRKRLRQAGYSHYEVSAFCKPGYQSQHNLAYWNYSPYIGIGPSAASFFEGMAYQQVSSLDRYVADPTPAVIKRPESLSAPIYLQNYLIANLRRLDGLSYHQARVDLGLWLPERFADVISRFQAQGLLRRRADRLQLTVRGVELMNTVLEAFM